MTLRRLSWTAYGLMLSLIGCAVLGALIIRDHKTDIGTGHFPLLAKRIFLAHPNDTIINFTDLRISLQADVAQSPEKVGLYFEYLPTGTSIGVNGGEEFYRASLVKLPVVMRAYKYIEEGKLSLDDVLTVQDIQINREYGSLWQRGAGTQLTVRELIHLILDESDNTAFNVLYERVNVQLRDGTRSGDQSSDDIYDYLDIPRSTTTITPMITPKNYTSILKSLYFSSYLTFHDSNEILSIMSNPHAENWLRSAVPGSIQVADKIGVNTANPPEQHVFADCGIVYYPLRPYSLCVMVNTSDQTKAIPIIQKISQSVYDYIRQQPK